MGLVDDLIGGPVALDTSLFIDLIEEEATFFPVVEPVFAAIADGRLTAVASALTLLEVLVVPLRHGDAELARRYEALLTRSRGLELVEVSRAILRDAAVLRAASGVRTPDAIQLATALAHRCPAFLTNDRQLPALPGLRVLQLADLLPAHRSRKATPRVSER
ncbi:MAG: PIN domain-containing protein [Acidobacteria bacterium]|nr:PIN domain-containing protein [Acidobacteriota bacterium]